MHQISRGQGIGGAWPHARLWLAAVIAFLLVVTATILAERYEASQALDEQRSAASDEVETAASRLTRDLTQEVAIVQGLTALVAANPDINEAAFRNYTNNLRRTFHTLRRVYLVRNGKVTHTDRPASSAESLTRLEQRLTSSDPSVPRAIEQGTSVMSGPFKITEGDDVFLFARPIFLGDGKPGTQNFWGFAGINVEDHAITCRLGLCEERPKYRMALRIVSGETALPPFFGDAALFEESSRPVEASARIPGIRIDMAAVPADGWISAAPRRWHIRVGGILLAILAAGCTWMLFSGTAPGALRTRIWALAASLGVLLLVLGLGAVFERFLVQRGQDESRSEIVGKLEAAVATGTRDLSDDIAVSQNLSTFVEADPKFSDASFLAYAQKLRQQHPRILSLQLARDGKVSHIEPSARAEFGTMGLDLRRNPADAAAVDQSIEKGTPIFTGPLRLGPNEVFIYRKPIYLGDGQPSRAQFWGFATVVLGRNAVVCLFGICDQAGKYRYAVRLRVNDVEQAPFFGDAALFKDGSDAAQVSIRLPAARVEMAAIPTGGWSADAGKRWLIWAIASPLALLAAATSVFVFMRLVVPVLQIWIGLIVATGGLILLLLRQGIEKILNSAGIADASFVKPAIVTLTVFAIAYALNAALAVFVWPPKSKDRSDVFQRAPAILRTMVSLLLYGTAGLWAAAFAFNLDLTAVGFTSGAVGIVVGFATQHIIQDFFSGVMIGIERPYAPGDWIEITGQNVSGVITDLTWRTTSISNGNLDTIIIPNSVLSQAVVINRSRPHSWTQIPVPLTVDTSVPHREVEARVFDALRGLAEKNEYIQKDQPILVYATGCEDGKVHYEVVVPAILGSKPEAPIKGAILSALNEVFGLDAKAEPANAA